MKKILTDKLLPATLIMLSMLLIAPSMAQEDDNTYKTLFGSSNRTDGFYGALMINFSQLENDDMLLLGAKGGWIIDQSFTIGLAGYGLINDVDFTDIYSPDVVNLAGGYGGLLLEPILFPNYPVHVAFPVIIGAGGVAYIDNMWQSHTDHNYDPFVYDSDAFFVLEPGIELEFNLTHFLRLGLAATYRYTSDLELYKTDEDILNGFNFGASFKVGKFWSNRY